MSQYTLESCTIRDSLGIAKIQIKQDWAKPWFRELWFDAPRGDVIRSARLGHRLTLADDRDHLRHQKVTHNPTGEIVGYARWRYETEEFPANEWREAKGPRVNDERFQGYLQEFNRNSIPFNAVLDNGVKQPIRAIYAQTVAQFRQSNPSGDHIRLEMWAIHPDHRSGEVERLLLRSGTEAADRSNLPVATRLENIFDKDAFYELDWEQEGTYSQHLLADWGINDTFTAEVWLKWPTTNYPVEPVYYGYP